MSHSLDRFFLFRIADATGRSLHFSRFLCHMKLKILGVVETFALDELIADPLDHAFRVVRRLHITKYTPCVVFLTVTHNRDTHTQRRGRGSRVQRLECIHAADVVAVSLGVAEKTLHVTRKRSQLHRKQWYSLF